MLVLTRKIDEAIRIGDDIVVKVIDIDKNVVRLGIEAPKEIAILREELYAAVTEENRNAAQPHDDTMLIDLGAKLKRP